MKKNKMMRLASCLLVAVLLTTSMISGTFAKYVTEVSGTDTARVAKFDVNTTVATIDLFGESKIYDTKDDANYTVKANDAEVVDSTDGIIAPGTWGEFAFDIKDASEVTVQYDIAYTVNEAGVPLEWSVDGGATWTDDLTDVTGTVAANATLDDTVYVMWRWAFTGAESDAHAAWTDEQDTALGQAGSATPSVKIDVTFTQVD